MKNLKLTPLRTNVGLFGSMKQQEVGGPVCLGIILGVIVSK